METRGEFECWQGAICAQREMVEKRVVKIVQNEIVRNEASYRKAVVGDAIVIRKYVPVMRYGDDIDLIFPADISFETIVKLARGMSGHPIVLIETPEASSVRIKYRLPGVSNLEDSFAIHLHSRGMWYGDKCFELDGDFFSSVTWDQLPFAGGGKALLPVPRLEELFVLASRRFVGSDKVDYISMLSYPGLDFTYIVNRVRKLEMAERLAANLQEVEMHYDKLLEEWSFEHCCDMSDTVKVRVTGRLAELKGLLE